MCLYPLKIWTRPNDNPGRPVTVSCGNCIECLRKKSIEWAFRILDECSLYKNNCFITLTYNDEHLPENGSVNHRDYQLFLKRLRKFLNPLKIRFFLSAEYGKKFGRPHYHLIVFGWKPDDMVFFCRENNSTLYRSKVIEKIWTYGFSSVGDVTYDSALYCAKYMQKAQFMDGHKHIQSLPFIQMSTHPGIGYSCVYNVDLAVGKIYRNGKSCSIPRYYLKVMERDGVYLDDFKLKREDTAKVMERCSDLESRRLRAIEFQKRK